MIMIVIKMMIMTVIIIIIINNNNKPINVKELGSSLPLLHNTVIGRDLEQHPSTF